MPLEAGIGWRRTVAAQPIGVTAHYHQERNHQGKGNHLLTPLVENKGRKIHCHQRLGGLLKFYARAA
jgi:hypothetical protein